MTYVLSYTTPEQTDETVLCQTCLDARLSASPLDEHRHSVRPADPDVACEWCAIRARAIAKRKHRARQHRNVDHSYSSRGWLDIMLPEDWYKSFEMRLTDDGRLRWYDSRDYTDYPHCAVWLTTRRRF